VADFAGDDKGALDSILNTFLEETEKNMVLMDEALVENNREQVAKIAHKMIPVFSMVGANITVQNLRVLEKNDSEMTDEKWKILIFELKGQVSAIMDNLADGMCGI
jgi:Hpt domain.